MDFFLNKEKKIGQGTHRLRVDVALDSMVSMWKKEKRKHFRGFKNLKSNFAWIPFWSFEKIL